MKQCQGVYSANFRGTNYTSYRVQSLLDNIVIRKGQPRLELDLKRVYVGKEFLTHGKNSNFCLMNEHNGRIILFIFLCVFFPFVYR